MVQVTSDRWRGSFTTTTLGRHSFQVEAWVDTFGSWRDEVERKLAAGQEDLDSELAEGAAILEEVAASGLRGADRRTALTAAEALRDGGGPERGRAALAPEVAVAVERATTRPERLRTAMLEVDVDRERARVGAWYELFPRSFGGLKGRGGAAAGPGRARVRRGLPGPDPPHRRHPPQGAQQRPHRGPGRPRQPLGDRRRGGRPHGGEPRSGHAGRTSRAWSPRRATTTSRSPSTSRSSARRTTRGWPSTPTGSTAARTGRSSTPRTRPSGTRTSTTSTSAATTGRPCGRRSATPWCSGSSAGCGSSGSTTPTPSRSASGSG